MCTSGPLWVHTVSSSVISYDMVEDCLLVPGGLVLWESPYNCHTDLLAFLLCSWLAV